MDWTLRSHSLVASGVVVVAQAETRCSDVVRRLVVLVSRADLIFLGSKGFVPSFLIIDELAIGCVYVNHPKSTDSCFSRTYQRLPKEVGLISA
jgi:hypothetical protein